MLIQLVISWHTHFNHSWDLNFSRNFNDRESNDFISLLNTIDSTHFNQEASDKRVWVGHSSGEFSCKSFFDILSCPSSSSLFPQFSVIWKGGIPTIIKVFAWLASLGKVSTCDMVQVRGHLCLSLHRGVYCVRGPMRTSTTFCYIVSLLRLCGQRP